METYTLHSRTYCGNVSGPATTLTILLLLLQGTLVAAPSVDLLSIAIGSWTVLPSEAPVSNRSHYNKLSASAYLSAAQWKAHISAPVQWTVHRAENEIRSQLIRVADISFYVGRRVGPIEPRIGLKVPTGYRTDSAWIGSHNLKLQVGAGLNALLREQDRFNASGELMWALYLTERGALAHRGSWDLVPTAKFSFQVAAALRLGVEVLGTVKYARWQWGITEFSAGVVPQLYCDIEASEKLRVAGAIGAGPSFSKKFKPNETNDVYGNTTTSETIEHGYSHTSVNVSVAIHLYP